MASSELLAYTGAVTGVIGAITGVAGAVMGFIGYRRSERIKALDLRIELRKLISDLFEEVQELAGLLADAKKSRTAVAAATGRIGSGAMERWNAQWDADSKSIEAFEAGLDDLNVDHSKDDHATLESNLVEAHSLLTSVRRLREKFESSMASDDRERDHIRADVRTQAAGRQSASS
jgi:hypothetical protein